MSRKANATDSEVAYRLHYGGHLVKCRSKAEWDTCEIGLGLGPTSIFGSRSVIIMLCQKSLTLWCFDPDFDIKASWFDFREFQVGKIWSGPRGLTTDSWTDQS